VTKEEALQRMRDAPMAGLALHERVPAVARIFDPSGAPGHDVDLVPEQPAPITNAFGEAVRPQIWISIDQEQQRMPARDTRVLIVAISSANPLVGVVPQKAGERVADPDTPLCGCEHRFSTPRAPVPAVAKDMVVDGVTPDEAAAARGSTGGVSVGMNEVERLHVHSLRQRCQRRRTMHADRLMIPASATAPGPW
jgi:hypothetical protein